MSARPLRHLAAALLCAACIAAAAGPARAERLIASLTNHRVLVTSNFTGEQLVLFGAVERDASTPPRPGPGCGHPVRHEPFGRETGAAGKEEMRRTLLF